MTNLLTAAPLIFLVGVLFYILIFGKAEVEIDKAEEAQENGL